MHSEELDWELIGSAGSMEALRPEWEALWERCPAATPFQSPSWQIAWWRYFGTGKLQIIALRSRGRLKGILPVSVIEEAESHSRIAVLNGTGISDYLDVLMEPEIGQAGAGDVLRVLYESGSEWDRGDFQEIPEGSTLLKTAVHGGLQIEIVPMQVCPRVHLPETTELYFTGLISNHRRSLRRARRLLEGVEDVEIEAVTRGNLKEFLDDLFRLHRQRWNQRDLPGVLIDSSVQAFHKEVAARMLLEGRLRMYRLRLKGVTASVLYLFSGRDAIFCYLGGFDPAMERFSPGSVIIGHAIEVAISEGKREFDFLRGNEAYKYLWGGRDRTNYRMVIKKKTTLK